MKTLILIILKCALDSGAPVDCKETVETQVSAKECLKIAQSLNNEAPAGVGKTENPRFVLFSYCRGVK